MYHKAVHWQADSLGILSQRVSLIWGTPPAS